MSSRGTLVWTFVLTSVAAFMVNLDNLVVTMALPSIRADLHAGLSQLEWTVNAYTLGFAVFLLTGAALGDRFGRRRVFAIGLSVFTLASAAAALAPNAELLIAARAVQGIGAATVLPLSLTILSAAVPPTRRGAALGVWGGVSGLGVAVGPVVGGAVVQGAAWQWIFWLNVPIGLLAAPLAWRRLAETRGAPTRLDLLGVVLASGGFAGVVDGVIRGNAHGWTSVGVLGPILGGVLLLAAFLVHERRTATPMLPLQLFRSRSFTAANLASVLFSFGMFGSIFLLAQSLQLVQGYGPLGAGLRTLPWTAMPLLIAPIAGPLTDRIGGRPLIVTGLALMAAGIAWIALVMSVSVSYASLVPAFVLAGVGMSLFFVPINTVVFGATPVAQHGVASGANNAIREIGGVFGVAVLASVFSARGGYSSSASYVDGLRPAVLVGAAVVAAGAVAAAFIRSRRAEAAAAAVEADPADEVAGRPALALEQVG
ncbi:MAG: DHA2 family efflux MFS transporter permease subunit [Mycobacteriales bacterium]